MLGEPRLSPKYPEDGKSWTIDLVLSDDGVREAQALGLNDKLSTNRKKPRDVNGQPFLTFKQREFQKDGKKNDPIEVKDIAGRLWDQNKLIGNGSVVDVRFNLVETVGRDPGIYPKGIRVLEHVPYEGKDFDPVSEDDPYYAAAKAASEVAESATPDFEKDFGLETILPEAQPELDDDLPV